MEQLIDTSYKSPPLNELQVTRGKTIAKHLLVMEQLMDNWHALIVT